MRHVNTVLPELAARWPLQGIEFDALTSNGVLILVVHARTERVMLAGPKDPVVTPSVPPLPSDATGFREWEEAIRSDHAPAATDLVAAVPFPDAAAESDYPRPSEQWDLFSEVEKSLWQAAVVTAFTRGLKALMEQPASDDVNVDAVVSQELDTTLFREHDDFSPPENVDQPLWRYMSMTKFVSLLETQSVAFARADRLGDIWEGQRGKANARPANEGPGVPTDGLVQAAQQMYVSCWHEQDGESAAMWSLYAGWDPIRREGIAVRTTFRQLVESLGGTDELRAGRVLYHDYDADFVPEDNVFAPFMRKRQSFEHEREVRVVIWRPDGGPEPSLAVPVDVPRLISEIRVAPSAPDWLRTLIQSLVMRYGIDVPVSQSEMDAAPLR